MKVKTSVTLSPELLKAIDNSCGTGNSRSEFLERAAWEVLRRAAREERDKRDIAIINQHADQLNAEAADVLAMQAAWFEQGERNSEAG
jgi:metal-responsive CopG/Arc/MetJ family transcriptional regulator